MRDFSRGNAVTGFNLVAVVPSVHISPMKLVENSIYKRFIPTRVGLGGYSK